MVGRSNAAQIAVLVFTVFPWVVIVLAIIAGTP